MARGVAKSRVLAAGGWRTAVAVAVETVTLVALAYQLPVSIDVDMGNAWSGALVARGFYDAEGAYRWSRGESDLVFPDPGATRSARVELLLSGFRPRDAEPPLLVVETGPEGRPGLRVQPSRRIDTYSFGAETRGLWSSTLVLHLRADTFSPGAFDERALGVRLHRARLVLHGPTIPPARQVLAALALVLLLFVFLRPGVRLAGSLGLSMALAIGYGGFRLFTAFFIPGIALGLAILAVCAWAFPWGARFVRDVSRGSARSLRLGAAAIATRWAGAAAVIAVVGAGFAYALRPSFTLDVGSGEAEMLVSRFTGYDRAADATTFRRPLPDATVDLRDFGWGSPWTLSIQAAAEAGRQGSSSLTTVLVRTSEEDFAADLGAEWRTYRFDLPDPGRSWRSGTMLTFPGLGRGNEQGLEIASIRVDRGTSFPSMHALVLLVGSCWFLAAALSATGLSPRVGAAGGISFALLLCTGMYLYPVIVTPSLGRALLGGAAALGAAVCARGWIGALAEREILPELAPGALALATVGLVLWFLSTASPLYVGGHFGYHSAIAEEIWRGKFFLYYFPGPDNMLSHQPQWGNLVVPHPSFYHTVAAPFAAFSRDAFYLLTKVFLAVLLFGMTLSSALVATSVGTRRTGVYAAAALAGAPTGAQLLGLGHLMTIFGAWAAAVGMGFLVIQEQNLSRRREWLIGMGLVTLCFLSYTGSLLFGSVTLVLAVLWLYRSEKELAMRLGALLLAGWGLALLLYYIHWVVPFVRDSLPTFLAGKSSGGAIDLASRMRLEPEKLSYTFGSWLVPVVGLLGLGFAQTRVRRVLLLCWGSVLVLFTVLDLFFNFLLKHHYFTLPAVAVGVGLALERLHGKRAWGGLIVGVFLVFLWVMGLAEAVRVAGGGV
jgi:hypothetical protein